MFRTSWERDSDAEKTMVSDLQLATMPFQLEYDGNRLVCTWPCTRALAAAGVVSGLLSRLLEVGGGFIVIPVLMRATRLPFSFIVATALAIIALILTTGVFRRRSCKE